MDSRAPGDSTDTHLAGPFERSFCAAVSHGAVSPPPTAAVPPSNRAATAVPGSIPTGHAISLPTSLGAVSATNVWMVGYYYCNSIGFHMTLIEHYPRLAGTGPLTAHARRGRVAIPCAA